MKALIVIDMQNDFLTGSLANKEGVDIIPNVVKEITSFRGEVLATLDTHSSDPKEYLSTNEGKHLPVPHCLKGSEGHKACPEVHRALEKNEGFKGYIEKPTFGFLDWREYLPQDVEEIELIGVCTDICVLSNAAILKALYPEAKVSCRPSCCAGVTPDLHDAAIKVMRSIQVDILD